ncbi:MAG: glycosyltransferase family 2 protein [Lentisphaerae bacterium]|nr:glycosyltransferase family 2 protein [Lentisphaerota bacterium]
MDTDTPYRPLVLMPCYNEAPRIEAVIRDVKRVLPEATIVVIDDTSTDDSARLARAAGAIVLTHGCNLGYGAALETGYLFARRHGYAPVMQLDADGQHPPEELPRLLEALRSGEADIVIGSRHFEGPDKNTPFVRRCGHALFAGIIRLMTGLRTTDPTSGLRALSQRAIDLFASGVFPCDYPDSDVIVMAHLAGLRVREVPVTMRAREGGASMHSGLKPLYYAIKMLLSLFIVLLNLFQWRRWRAAALARTAS